jgi:small subunit ribosomal protein S15e
MPPTKQRAASILPAARTSRSLPSRRTRTAELTNLISITLQIVIKMADAPRKRSFRKYSYRGVDLEQLLDMSNDEMVELYGARQRRRFQRGLNRKCMSLIKKLRKARKAVEGTGEKPEPVRTHLRNMVIIPEMIGSIIGVYNGKTFNQVEIKPDMLGDYLAEYSITYKPVRHGRAGIGSTTSSRFIPLK